MSRSLLHALPGTTVVTVVVAVLLLAASAGPSRADIARALPMDARDSTSRFEQQLAAVRTATARYRDAAVAIADGYVNEQLCVAMPGAGAMGVHFIHPRRMGMVMRDGRIHGTDTVIDPEQPEILVYEPQKDGSLALVAVEWYTSQEAWGARPHPTIFGVPFNTMQDDPATPAVDEGHGFTPHFDLHLWLHRDNPDGAFAQWNPNVSCPADAAPAPHAKH
jgi:hypothetical protein